MSKWNKPELENMLEDVINELDLSDVVIEKHGPLGTPPSELVRLVLEQKDQTIRMLKAGMKDLTNKKYCDQCNADLTDKDFLDVCGTTQFCDRKICQSAFNKKRHIVLDNMSLSECMNLLDIKFERHRRKEPPFVFYGLNKYYPIGEYVGQGRVNWYLDTESLMKAKRSFADFISNRVVTIDYGKLTQKSYQFKIVNPSNKE